MPAEALPELRRAYRIDTSYRDHLSDGASRVLDEIIEHPRFAGATDPAALSLVGCLLRIIQPQRVLQIGTYVGFSTVVIADTLAENRNPGHLWTVEPDREVHDLARGWIDGAALGQVVSFIDGYSTDAAVVDELTQLHPFDIVYVDSSHSYQGTLDELDLVFGREWLADAGLLILHDAARSAAQWDPTSEGGVRRALDEWLAARPSRYERLVLEPPLWPNPTGLGLVRATPTPPAGS